MTAKTEIRDFELEPCEALLAQVIRLALRDARQRDSQALQREAVEFLWLTCPGIAERAHVEKPPHLAYLRERFT